MDKKDLGLTIIKSACQQPMPEAVIDISEAAFASLLEERVLKQIPGLKFVIGCLETVNTVRDWLFLKKVATFLLAFPPLSTEERERFLKDIAADEQVTRRLSDALVLLLDRLDDLEKPKMLAKAFAAYGRGKISQECFRRLARAIEIGFAEDLNALTQPIRNGNEEKGVWLQNLLHTGLVIIKERDNFEGYFRGTYTGLEVSALGKAFVECMNELS